MDWYGIDGSKQAGDGDEQKIAEVYTNAAESVTHKQHGERYEIPDDAEMLLKFSVAHSLVALLDTLKYAQRFVPANPGLYAKYSRGSRYPLYLRVEAWDENGQAYVMSPKAGRLVCADEGDGFEGFTGMEAKR